MSKFTLRKNRRKKISKKNNISTVLWLLPLGQLLCFATTVTIEYYLMQRVGPLFSIGVLSVFTFFMYVWIASTRKQWPQREEVLRLGSRSGIVFGLVGAVCYGIAFFRFPTQFEFSQQHLLWIVPLLGSAIWLGMTILGVCIGDTVATMYKVHRKKEHYSFRDFP